MFYIRNLSLKMNEFYINYFKSRVFSCIWFCYSIFSPLKRLFEEPETRAVTQDKPYAGKTQNSSALNTLTSDPLLSFVERESRVLAVMRLGL